jgi:hypothetical protein
LAWTRFFELFQESVAERLTGRGIIAMLTPLAWNHEVGFSSPTIFKWKLHFTKSMSVRHGYRREQTTAICSPAKCARSSLVGGDVLLQSAVDSHLMGWCGTPPLAVPLQIFQTATVPVSSATFFTVTTRNARRSIFSASDHLLSTSTQMRGGQCKTSFVLTLP